MKKSQLLLLVIAVFVLSSCSKNIYVSYNSEKESTGKVVLKPSKPTVRTFVTINDNLVVDKKRVKSVTITNIPDGEHQIHYASDNMWYKDKMDVQIPLKMSDGKSITKLVEVPPFSTGYWIYTSVMIFLLLGGGVLIY